jgi:hypothetical protein
MAHFKFDQQSNGDLITNYPHDPEDLSASIADYVEAQFSGGWEFIGFVPTNVSSSAIYVFKANAQ